MRVILSEAKGLTYEAWITHVRTCDDWRRCEVPSRLRGPG
jgi:hypothetical protein